MKRPWIFAQPFSGVYPAYVQKAERKGRTRAEVDRIICWLTGYDRRGLEASLAAEESLEAFFEAAPRFHPNAVKITGSVCGHKVQEIEDKTMWKIRCLDKLVDELAKGKDMEAILRS